MTNRWDAGETGCAHLILQLRRQIDALAPGDRLEILAQDPGARSDLPAWCEMTGHRLVSADPPVFVIEKKRA